MTEISLSAPDPEKTSVLIVFDGVLIASSMTPNTYQIGVVPAPDHQFSIIVTEFQKEGSADSPIHRREFTFGDYPKNRIWTFLVDEKPATAAGFESGEPPKRDVNPVGDKRLDHRWPLNLSTDFPSHFGLTKQVGALNPIINFMNGLFFTKVLTPELKPIFRKADGEAREKIGIVSAQFAATIEDIKTDGKMLLKDGDGEEIFNLVLKANRRFAIVFQNTPPHQHPSALGARGHFPLFYSAFAPMGAMSKRYDLVFEATRFPGSSIPDPAIEEEGGIGGPAPFRCGPVGVNDTLS